MKIFITVIVMALPSLLCCQQQQAVPSESANIIFNGAYIVINKKAALVIQNRSPSALTIRNGGGIISEGADNDVMWNIENDSDYSVPFVAKDLTSIPVSFNTSNGSGSGSFTLSTYSGAPDWKNADYLPPGVTDVNKGKTDNSKHVIDRFWKIDAEGYTQKPTLTDVIFNYREFEWSEDSNIIKEKNLAAQNWNGTDWTAAKGTDIAASNYVKIASLKNYFPWWTLVDSNFALTSQANIALRASDQNNLVITNQNTFGFYLGQNFPNPFSGNTTISYSLSKQYASAEIAITNSNGNVIKQVNLPTGRQGLSGNNGSIRFNASSFTSGPYQYSLIVDGRLIDTKQMILTK
jgi:hypothetical protein